MLLFGLGGDVWLMEGGSGKRRASNVVPRVSEARAGGDILGPVYEAEKSKRLGLLRI
jgi:hypothetical protein